MKVVFVLVSRLAVHTLSILLKQADFVYYCLIYLLQMTHHSLIISRDISDLFVGVGVWVMSAN